MRREYLPVNEQFIIQSHTPTAISRAEEQIRCSDTAPVPSQLIMVLRLQLNICSLNFSLGRELKLTDALQGITEEEKEEKKNKNIKCGY